MIKEYCAAGLIIVGVLTGNMPPTCPKHVSDKEGNVYGTVVIGEQCWMSENLRLGTQIPGSKNQGDAHKGDIEKYCYGDDVSKCKVFGALYQWHTVMGLPEYCDTENTDCNIKKQQRGICPKGWHVPTDTEWHTLELQYAEPATEDNCDLSHDNGDCDPAGAALKSKDVWNGEAGTNISGFTGLPAGYRDAGDNQFYCNGDDECDSGHFWTASVHSDSNAYQHNLYLEDQEVHRGNYAKSSGFSLRCLMDY